MPRVELVAEGKVWLYEGPGGWHFFTLPRKVGAEVRKVADLYPKAFGSLRLTATIGKTSWQTSVFPDKKSGSYVLPIKKDVRKAEGIGDGDRVRVTLVIAAP